MELFVGYAEREPTGRHAGADVDAPSVADAEGHGTGHAVAAGSRVALCGATVDRTVEQTWPPAPAAAACPRCRDTANAYLS